MEKLQLFQWFKELWDLWMKNIEARRDLRRVRMAIKLANLKQKADKKDTTFSGIGTGNHYL